MANGLIRVSGTVSYQIMANYHILPPPLWSSVALEAVLTYRFLGSGVSVDVVRTTGTPI